MKIETTGAELRGIKGIRSRGMTYLDLQIIATLLDGELAGLEVQWPALAAVLGDDDDRPRALTLRPGEVPVSSAVLDFGGGDVEEAAPAACRGFSLHVEMGKSGATAQIRMTLRYLASTVPDDAWAWLARLGRTLERLAVEVTL
jgi:hypothetical protein